MTKERNSNLELYRIIVMLAIVAHHYVVNSGLWAVISEEYFSTPSLFYWLFGMWGKTGINCFILITGYFMCQKQITIRKFLKLILQIEFYNVMISLIFFTTNYRGFGLRDFCMQILPIQSVSSGFISCFLLFWLTIPFLNILIRNLTKKMHLMLIMLFLFIYTGMLYIPRSTVCMNYVSWFIVLYFISSFIRLYPDAIYKSQSTKTWGGLSVLAIVLAMGSIVVTTWRNDAFNRTHDVYWFVSDSNAILALLAGMTTFMFFKNIKIPHIRFINTIASTTFGVLLIHANSDAMRQWLWGDIVNCVGHYNDTYYYLYAPIAVLCIFTVCSLIDYIRINTVERWTFRWIDSKWQRKI